MSAVIPVKMRTRLNSTGSDFVRKRINFIEGSNISISMVDDGANNEIDITISATGGGGGGAPTNAEYFVLSLNGTLTNERRLVFDTGNFSVTDNGAGADYDVNTIQDIDTGASPTFVGMNLTGFTQGSVLFIGSAGAVSQDNSAFFYNPTNDALSIGQTDTALIVNSVSLTSRLTLDLESDLIGQLTHVHNSTASVAANNILAKSRGTHASPTIVSSGDTLGILGGYGYTGNSGVGYQKAAQIRFIVGTGTPSTTSMPGQIGFYTSPDASITPVRALLIDQDKIITMDAYSTGIAHFSSSGVISSSLIVNADISASAAIDFSKLATLPSANILVGNGSNVATAVAVTGDISLSNTGVTAYSGTVPVNKGGTNITSYTTGDLLYASGTSTLSKLGIGTSNSFLSAESGVPFWKTINSLSTATVASGDLLMIADISDSNNLKQVTAQSIANLAGASASATNLQNSSGVANHPYAAFFGPTIRNLIPNPRFENNVTDSWSTSGLVTVTRQTSAPYVGSAHARITWGGVGTTTNDGFYSSAISITANETYIAGFWLKSATGASQLCTIKIQGNVTAAQTYTATVGTSYQLFPVAIVLGGSDTTIQVSVVANATNSSQSVDLGAVLLSKIAADNVTTNLYCPPYFDGSFAGHSWSGTAHNSSSYSDAPYWVEKKNDVDGAFSNTGLWLNSQTGEFNTNRFVLRIPGPSNQGYIVPRAIVLETYPLYISGELTTLNQFGFIGAIVKIENTANGAAALFKAAATTEDIVQVDAGSLTSGSALSIYSPEDKATFAASGGAYFKFTGKGASATRPDYVFGPEVFAYGVATETLNKSYTQMGGGNYKRTQTSSGRTVTWSGTTITKSTGSDFNAGSVIYVGDIVVVDGQSAYVMAVAATTLTTLTSASPTIGSATQMDLVDRQYSPFYQQMEGAGPADHRLAQGAYGLNNFYVDSGRNFRIGFPQRTTTANTCSGSSGSTTITLSSTTTGLSVGDWIVPYGHEQRQIVALSGTTVRVVPALDSTISAGTPFEWIENSAAPQPSQDDDADPINQTLYAEQATNGIITTTTETSLFTTVPMFPSGSLIMNLNDRNRSNNTGKRTVLIKISGTMIGSNETFTARLKSRYRTGTWTTLSTNYIGSIPGSDSKGFTLEYRISMNASVSSQTISFNMNHTGYLTDHLVVDATSKELMFDGSTGEVLQDGELSSYTTSSQNFRPDVEFDVTIQSSGSGSVFLATSKLVQFV